MLKRLIFILKHGLKSPRFYIEGLSLKWKQLLILPLIVALFMALNLTRQLSPLMFNLQTELKDSVSYLPQFQVEDGTMHLDSGEKALYYQAELFQLIIDDQVKFIDSNEESLIVNQQNEELALDQTFNLLLAENQIIFYTKENQQLLNFPNYLISNRQELQTILNHFSEAKLSHWLLLIFACFIATTISYWYLMLISAILAGILNFRLNFPLPLHFRLKLAIVCSFTPLIIIECIKMIFPAFTIHFYLFTLLIVLLLYHTFKEHTLFMRDVLSKIDVLADQPEDKKNDSDEK